MKKIKTFLAGSLALACLTSFVACAPGGGSSDSSQPGDNSSSAEQKAVSSIAVETLPSRTDYFIDEMFDPAGGALKVTYEDGTSEIVSLTAEGVELSEVNTSRVGNKTVTVRYGGARTTFRVTVTEQGFAFTFDMNYEGDTDNVVNVSKGTAATKMADPVRNGYTFYNWYADENCTVVYDFSTPVTQDTTVYAAWKDDAAVYYEVTYDLNYYGVAPQKYTQIVKSGESAKTPAVATVRAEYSFNGWYSDEAATQAFDGNAAISGDRTVYAGWTKTKTGTSTYVFEAEDTDLTGKVGPGFSGEAVAEGMIESENGKEFVTYLYKRGLSLEFYIASDSDVDDAVLTLSLAEEFGGITLTDETWQIRIYNDAGSQSYTTVKYGSVNLNGRAFEDKITASISLKKGYNLIQLVTNNGTNPAGEGNGTYAGTAPMVDCIKITTSAVLGWDANYGLPKVY